MNDKMVTSRKFPSKTFLLGEYAVLDKGQALLLASAPFFTANYESKSAPCPFHPLSEAGIYWQKNESFFKDFQISFHDPHEGRGGFGASGAEFLSLFSYKESKNPWEAHRAFKSSTKSSGADILTQLASKEGENALVCLDLNQEKIELLALPNEGQFILNCFHTGQKLPTRFTEYPKLPLAEMNSITGAGVAAWKNRNIPLFAKALKDYGALLASLGLLVPHSQTIVNSLYELGAVAAKGCGAGGADVVIAITKESISTDWCKQNNIRKVFETKI